jgi:hypothetical protein
MKIAFTVFVVLQFHFTIAQSVPLPQNVREDFCRNAQINFKYGSDAFKAWIIHSGRQIGYNSIIQIENAVKNICANKPLQDEFL